MFSSGVPVVRFARSPDLVDIVERVLAGVAIAEVCSDVDPAACDVVPLHVSTSHIAVMSSRVHSRAGGFPGIEYALRSHGWRPFAR